MIRRHITALLRQSLADFPAVLLIGARQVGKTTLARQLVDEGLLDHYITLDDLTTLEAARADPDGLLRRFKGSVALDEVQRVPDLMRALKREIDRRRKRGRFLLTGSAHVLSRPGVSESLAGRVDIIHLEGLSAGEILGQPEASTFIGDLFTSSTLDDLLSRLEAALSHAPPLDQSRLQEMVYLGGFPEVALRRSPRFARRWFAAYQTTYVERDVRDLTRLPDIVSFGKLFRLSGLRTATLLNIKNLGADAGMDQRTAGRYLSLLEMTFQINRLAPWHASTRKRLVKTPKLFINDPGLACHLCGLDGPRDLTGHPMTGALVETWAWAELRKLLALTPGIQPAFYRTHLGKEVDFVLEKGRRRWGIEIKWAESVSRRDLTGLRDMQEALGRGAQGMVLYMGDEIVAFSKTLAAVPVRCVL